MVDRVSKFVGVFMLSSMILASLIPTPSCAGPAEPTTTTTLDGACCEPDGGCLDVTEAACEGFGVYQGDGTVCDVGVCPPELLDGACCEPDGGCLDVTEAGCEGAGFYQGDGTVCDVGVCVVLCGDADIDGDVKAGDALIALRTAVGSAHCIVERCDYDGSGKVTASDALAILKTAVGQPTTPNCLSI